MGIGLPELREAELYEPFKRYLMQSFQVLVSSTTGDDFFHAQIVADDTGPSSGKWGTPDLIAVSVWRPEVLPGAHLTVRSFEIKRASQCDISSVHQALAHARFADYVYLAAPLDESVCSDSKRKEIEKQCLINGVGLFWIRDKEDLGSYYQPVRPVRKSPNPLAVDEFLAQKLSATDKDKIKRWGRLASGMIG